MPPRVRWFVACLTTGLASTAAIAATVHPRWIKTAGETVAWGLVGRAAFLLAALIAGLGVAANRDAPMPTGLSGCSGLPAKMGI